MLIIPAIDLKDGNCVRLRQGNVNDVTQFSDDPIVTAKQWQNAGARRLHIVDLNGAFAGKPVNADTVQAIHRALPDYPLQIGGGIRNLDTIDFYLQAGVSWVIIGTRAVQDPKFVKQACQQFQGHIIVGIDARNGFVATQGWAETTKTKAIDLVSQFADDGVSAIVYTDIDRDGMMQGVNVESTAILAKTTNIPIIASGGISNMSDIKNLMRQRSAGIIGAITGRAIYEGTLDLHEAQKYCDNIE